MRKPVARGGRCDGLSQVLTTGCKARYVHRGSHRPVRGTLAGRLDLDNGPDGPSLQGGGVAPVQRKTPGAAPPGGSPLRNISTPSMTPIESTPLGLNGLALAWESVAVVLGALALGLLVGLVARHRPRRAQAAESKERGRELESLRRIAGELARTPDVEGVVRALLDEI